MTEQDVTYKEEDGDSEGNREFVPIGSTDAHTFIAGLSTADQDNDPIGYRLMLALSIDGKHWKKTGMVIANHASVPCLAVEEIEGVETLYLFFVIVRSRVDVSNELDSATSVVDNVGKPLRLTPMAVAYTTDLVTWAYRFLDCEAAGFTYPEPDTYGLASEEYSANDPSVVRAIGVTPDEAADPDIQWMMYYTLHYGSGSLPPAVVLVAFAHHLYEFTWTTGNGGAPVLPPDGAPGKDDMSEARAEDPSAAPVDSGDTALGYLMFAGGNKKDYNWEAGLDDGVTVAGWDQIQETCGGFDGKGEAIEPIIMCNAVDAPGTALHLTWFAAAGGEKDRYIISIPDPLFGIKSGTYDTDGCNKVLEQDTDLAYEHNGIREAAVARFGGCWVMVYVTGIAPTTTTSII